MPGKISNRTKKVGSSQAYHNKARNLYGKQYCIRCGITKLLSLKVYNLYLHLHCIDGNFRNLHKDNWKTLCVSCHAKERWKPLTPRTKNINRFPFLFNSFVPTTTCRLIRNIITYNYA
jgi:5-methylcytosine-specific restriction endonuclease McrA